MFFVFYDDLCEVVGKKGAREAIVTYRSDESDDTADEFNNLTIADMRRFALICEEAGLSFEDFRRMLVDHDAVLIHALRAGLVQRPFADFRQMAERDANDPSIANLFVESRAASAVGKAARVLVGDSDSFFADVDAAMHRLEQMYEADAGEYLPFATPGLLEPDSEEKGTFRFRSGVLKPRTDEGLDPNRALPEYIVGSRFFSWSRAVGFPCGFTAFGAGRVLAYLVQEKRLLMRFVTLVSLPGTT